MGRYFPNKTEEASNYLKSQLRNFFSSEAEQPGYVMTALKGSSTNIVLTIAKLLYEIYKNNRDHVYDINKSNKKHIDDIIAENSKSCEAAFNAGCAHAKKSAAKAMKSAAKAIAAIAPPGLAAPDRPQDRRSARTAPRRGTKPNSAATPAPPAQSPSGHH